MSEVDLTGLSIDSTKVVEKKLLTPMQEVNAALKECGFGYFHIRLLITTLIGFVAAIAASNTTSYLLPTAECDLKMNLVQKGLLNAMPYFGMLSSSLIAGFLADTFGRKVFIQLGFGGIFLVTVISGCSQTFGLLVTAKFFEGLLVATGFSAAITLTSEFCYNEIRDRVLVCQSSFASIAQIVIAAISWGILINDWHFSFFGGSFVLNTWNFYLYAISLWSLTAFVLYLLIPESPKYFVTQNKFSEARAILINIYKENTRNSEDKFLYKDLWKNKESTITEEEKPKSNLSHQFAMGFQNIKPMFRRPMVLTLMLICLLNFCVMGLFNILRLWYPQVSAIIEHSSFVTANGEHQDICGLLDNYTGASKSRQANATSSGVCLSHKSGDETYINSIIIGCVCTVPFLISGILVTKLGKKPLIVVATLIACGGILGLRFASSNTAVLTLFAVVTAITQMLMCFNQAVTIEFFPTATRSLAISTVMTFGRAGSLVGNISFPVLLKIGCVVPFYTLAAMMMCSVVMALMLPSKKK